MNKILDDLRKVKFVFLIVWALSLLANVIAIIVIVFNKGAWIGQVFTTLSGLFFGYVLFIFVESIIELAEHVQQNESK